MPTFKYKARTQDGKNKSGIVKAPTKHQAKAMIQRMRLIPIEILTTDIEQSRQKSFLSNFIFRDKDGKIQIQLGEEKPKSKDIIIFTKQFSTMINSGVPLVQSLTILSEQQKNKKLANILRNIRGSIENGSHLSDSLEPYKDIFDSLYVSMVRAGEASGNLDVILLKLVTYIEKSEKIKGQVKSSLSYPIIVVFVAIGVISALLIFVVPAFAKQFLDSGKELPGLTQFVVDMSNALVDNWLYIIGFIIAIFFSLKFYLKTPAGQISLDKFLLAAPVIGPLMQKISVGRFCSTMATMLTSGVTLLDALSICASASGNKIIERFIVGIRSDIEQGAKFSVPLSKSPLIPAMVSSMVSVGEQTGALDEMLVKVSDFYEEEVDLAVKSMLSMIEPIMMIVIGGSVGFIVIAMYLPVFDLGGVVG
jgi:type IV pilus assembly protein PilC